MLGLILYNDSTNKNRVSVGKRSAYETIKKI